MLKVQTQEGSCGICDSKVALMWDFLRVDYFGFQFCVILKYATGLIRHNQNPLLYLT